MADSAMPTIERLKHAGGHFQIGGDKRTGRIMRMTDSPLEILFAEQKLTDLQYEMLRRLRLHWFFGQLAGNPLSANLDRVGSADWDGLQQNERELMHRKSFNNAWFHLLEIERVVINAVALTETGLTDAGAQLGFKSPYRGRVAALEVLHAGADRLARVWRA
jgi:hypothetical protein